MSKIGVFLSTFNPIHNGHIFIANKLTSEYDLDKILLVPSNMVLNKIEELLPVKLRREMCKLACKDHDDIIVYDIHIGIDLSCVFSILQELKNKFGNDDLYLIVESNLFLSFDSLYKYEKIFDMAFIMSFAFSKHEYELMKNKAKKFEKEAIINMFEQEYVSSECIRIKYAQGVKCSNYLDSKVEQYILENNVYGGNGCLFRECFNASKSQLSSKRFNHCQMVAKAAKNLAKLYNEDEQKAEIAGILHDIVKEKDKKYLLHIMEECGVNLSELEKKIPQIWHSIAGALYCEKYLGIEDKQIINAIKYHTTASRNMTTFEKIIYMADCISNDRKYEDVEIERELVKKDLDKALLFQLKKCITLLCEREALIHPKTFECYNQLCQKIKIEVVTYMKTKEMLKLIVNVLDNKKANNIKVIRIDDLTILCDYFVIADTNNVTHVKSLVDELEYELKQRNRIPKRIEKDKNSNWIVLDYQDIVVHIFHEDTRKFYDLENIWSDGTVISIDSLINEED